MLQGTYVCRVEPDNDNGGSCALTLANDAFELEVVRHLPYSIEDGNTVRGTFVATRDRVVLQAREHYSYQYETTKQESTRPMSRSFVATVGVDESHGLPVLDMHVDIDSPPFQARLRAAVPDVDDEPRSLIQIKVELSRTAHESREYWQRLSLGDFFAPLADGAWSPADHVRHLTKSVRPVTDALRLPRLLPRLLFGKATRASRSFAQLRSEYRAALAAGGNAGRFAPRPLPESERNRDSRTRLMRWHEEANDKLEDSLLRWSEEAADSHRLPHPLLGKLTVREMLFFTLYHNVHHVHAVERRRRSKLGRSMDD
jgi:hypothetical protein